MDWKEIVLLVVFLLFAVLMAHGWPEGEWAFGWTALAAIGTLLATFAAFIAANIALKISREDRERKEEEKYQKSLIYKCAFIGEVIRIKVSIDVIDEQMIAYDGLEVGAIFHEDIKEFLRDVSNDLSSKALEENMSNLHVFDGSTGGAIASMVVTAGRVKIELLRMINEGEGVTKYGKELAKLVRSNVKTCRASYADIKWPEEK